MTKRTDIVEHWTEEARNRLMGRTVKSVRYLKKAEMDALGWSESVLVIEFDDGTLVFPSRDDEGNGGGALFGQGPAPQNEELVFPVIRAYVMEREGPRDPSKPSPQDPRSKRTEETLQRLLKKIQGGKTVLHYNNEASLNQLKERGYIARMAKVVQGRVPYFRVELSAKGEAA